MSAPLNIEGALKLLAQPRDPSAAEENNISAMAKNDTADAGPDASVSSPAVAIEWEEEEVDAEAASAADAVPAKKATSRQKQLDSLTPEQRRELDERVRPLVAKRDQVTKTIFVTVAQLVAGLVADVRKAKWSNEDRTDLSKVADEMAASVAGIKAALAE